MKRETAFETLASLGELHIYKVGFRRDLGDMWNSAWLGGWDAVRARLRWIRSDWRRRSYWNGWIVEPDKMPEGLTRCGTGWTRVGAIRSLIRRVRRECRCKEAA